MIAVDALGTGAPFRGERFGILVIGCAVKLLVSNMAMSPRQRRVR